MATRKRPRFANIPEAVFARAAKDLTAADFLVLACILLCVNWRRGEAWPTVARLQQLSGLSKDTVTKAKAVLQRQGYIACAWREVKGGGHLIRVLFDMDGNPREFPTQSTRESRPKPPGISVPNHREKTVALPTSSGVIHNPHHSQEHSQGTQSAAGDPFSSIPCPHLSDGKQRMPLAEAFTTFLETPAGEVALSGGTGTSLWARVGKIVNNHHQDRRHRNLPCDYAGCIRAIAGKIAQMVNATKNPTGYLEASLTDALGKEADRAQQTRVARTGRRSGGFSSAHDAAALFREPQSDGPQVMQ